MLKRLSMILVFIGCMILIILIFNVKGNEQSSTPKDDIDVVQHIPTIISEEPLKVDHIKEKINQMTLKEKIGQLFIAGIDGTSFSDDTRAKIEKYKLGGLILFSDNLTDPNQSVSLLNAIKKNQADDIPLFLSVDQEGGRVTRLPGLPTIKSAKSIGQIDDPQMAFSQGEIIAQQLRAFGFQLNFAPVLDIDSNPNNTVIGDRAFGNNSDSVTELGIATMKGMQKERVVAAIKHFPGHGDTIEDSHIELPVLKKKRSELESNELVPFKAAINEGADMVLLAHMMVPDLDANKPTSMSKEVVNILRDDWKYDGVVITDDLSMGAIVDNYGMDEAVVSAVEAGVDMLLIAHGDDNLEIGFQGLLQAVQHGDISESRINQSVARILRLKEKYQVNNDVNADVSMEKLHKQWNELYDK